MPLLDPSRNFDLRCGLKCKCNLTEVQTPDSSKKLYSKVSYDVK